ncbi:MAG: hypothetical protein H3C30_11160 [Candidatus Hydrogenedentes bacterium]|nr:hypothetical protein [Candidatus Hydrogenedentota bacterium]
MKEAAPAAKIPALVHWATLGAAFSWPLGEYERLAGPVHLSHLFCLLIVAVMLANLFRHGRVGIPFDLVGAALLALPPALALSLTGHIARPYTVLAVFVAFFAGATACGSREAGLRLLRCFVAAALLTGLMGIGSAILTALKGLFAAPGARLPVFWADLSHAVSTDYLDPRFSVVALTVALMLALLFSLKRSGFLLTAMVLAAALCVLLMPATAAWRLWTPNSAWFFPPVILATLPLLWIVSLVTGKLLVSRRLDPPGQNLSLAGITLFITLVMILFQCPLNAGLAFLLGVAVSQAFPGVARGVEVPRFVFWPLVPTLLLASLHIWQPDLFPGDLRHYANRAMGYVHSGETDKANRLLDSVLKQSPKDARALFWKGNTALAEGHTETAVDFWGLSFHSKESILAPPSGKYWETARYQLRDHVSALQENLRGLSFERFLLLFGEEEMALSLLKTRAEGADPCDAPTGPLATALAALLGAPSLADTLQEWSCGELATALCLGHPASQTLRAPEGFPPAFLPLAVAVRTTPGGVMVAGWSPLGAFGGARRAMASSAFQEGSPPLWMEPAHSEDGLWSIPLPPVGRINLEGGGRVLFENYGMPWDMDDLDGWQVICLIP